MLGHASGASCSPPRSGAAPPTTSPATRCSGMLDARRRPGPQGVDHPARPGARRHLPEPRGRPLRLHAKLPARPDHRRARRPRRRAARLRRDHRRGERPGQATASRGRWSAAGACPTRSGPMSVLPAPGRSRRLYPAAMRRRIRRASSWIGGVGGSSTSATPERSANCGDNRDRLDRLAEALLEHESWTRTRPTGWQASSVTTSARRNLTEAVSSALDTVDAGSPALVGRSEA